MKDILSDRVMKRDRQTDKQTDREEKRNGHRNKPDRSAASACYLAVGGKCNSKEIRPYTNNNSTWMMVIADCSAVDVFPSIVSSFIVKLSHEMQQ